MKKDKGTTLLIIGLMLITLGLTILDNYKILQYTALILGLVIAIYSVFEKDMGKKKESKVEEKNTTKI